MITPVKFRVSSRPQINAIFGLVIFMLLSSTSSAQTPANPRTEPGTPAGSYSLDGLETINYFNGRVHFGLPLLKVGGRGSLQHTVQLTIDPQWPAEGKGCPGCGPTYPGGPGYFPLWAGQDDYEAGYSLGVMETVREGYLIDSVGAGCPYSDANVGALTTFRFKTADGSEFRLVDALHDGEMLPLQPYCGNHQTPGTFRGNVFVTKDGSAATFISDADVYDQRYGSGGEYRTFPSGILKFRDGTVYRIDVGVVSWASDRNGNRITYEYYPPVAPYFQYASLFPGKIKKITDSIGRVIQFSYDNPTGVPTERYDEISYNGFAAQPRTMRVYYVRLEHALRTPETLQDYCQLQVDCTTLFGGAPYIANPLVVSSVVLPNSQTYHFYYNKYAELTRFEVPTGGAVEFDYDWGLHDKPYYAIGDTYRRVVERRSYPLGGNGASFDSKTTYSKPEHSDPNITVASLGYVDVDHKGKVDGVETMFSRDRHFYYGAAGFPGYTANQNNFSWWFNYQSWRAGKEYKVEYFDSDTVTLLRRVEKTWQQATQSWWHGPDEPPLNNPRVVETTTTLADVAPYLVSKQTAIDPNNPSFIGFDQYSNQTDSWEFDYGPGSPGNLLRHTHTDYVTAAGYTDAQTGAHLRDLPEQTFVYDGNNNLLAKTLISYDGADLLPNPGVISWSDPGTARGNATTVGHWLNTTNNWLQSNAQYDQCGSVRRMWDPTDTTLINPTQIEYSSLYQYAYPTLNTSADPDRTTSSNGPMPPLTSTTTYDLSTGSVTSTIDANNITTNFEYNEILDRRTRSVFAAGDSAQTQGQVEYDDINRMVTTNGDLHSFNDNALKATTLFDPSGRMTETRTYESATNYIAVQRQYDALGRSYKTSNPFRPWKGETPVWTTSTFDALGRVHSITSPDGATVATLYAGNTVTVIDSAGKKRRTVSDGLGRLVRVDEPHANGNLDVDGAPFQSTIYEYNALDSLTKVTQGTQPPRTYLYDSLKRMLSATSPESGTICYGTVVNSQCQANGYNADGDMIYRTDARGVLTTYTYDELNRNTSVTYTNDPANTPQISRTFDNPTAGANGKGRLWKAETSGSTGSRTTSDTYDALGRTLTQRQQFFYNNSWSGSFAVSATYNTAGGVLTVTYPSGNKVHYNYDAAGRLGDKDAQQLAFTGNLGDGTNRTYSTGISYSDFGGISEEQFGTTAPVYNKLLYNVRGQLAEMRAGRTPNDTSWELGAIINHYSNGYGCSGASCNAPDNNGNLMRQEHWIPDGNQNVQTILTQKYEYDSLNRLQRVYDGDANQPVWQQRSSYDRWGNRTIDQANTSASVPHQAFNVDQDTNRLTVPSGQIGTMIYDNAGNLTNDSYSGNGQRVYDAESRMTSATDKDGGTATYVYDGDGHRVRRNATWQVYGLRGELLAEYSANAGQTVLQKEYGYRNGQLLVTATAATSWGPLPVLHDNPLIVGQTAIQSRHITELRDAIDSLRTHLNLAPYSWQQPAGPGSLIKADSISEMRTSLDQALGSPSPAYSAGLAQGFPIKGIHIQELRSRVLGAWGSGGVDIRWLVTDQLGTPRMIIDQTGSLANVSRRDYLPFGEEMFGIGGRTGPLGYTAGDSVRQKFTSKERDDETGLDYFGARYYRGPQGRFTTPDPLLGSGNPARPQTWNRYTYVVNNPLRMVDPNGLEGEEEEEQRRKRATPPPPRTIYVFVGEKDRGTPWTPDDKSAAAGYKATTVPGDDFTQLASGSPEGTQVKVINEGDAQFSPQGFKDALADKNAAGVVFIGDTMGVEDADHVYHATGLDFGSNGTLSVNDTVSVNAQNVAIFGCDSQNLKSMFSFNSPSQGFLGMSSGADGYSSPGWLGRAAFAAAQTFERGGNPDQALHNASSRFQNFGATAPFGPNNVSRSINVHNAEPTDVGDKVLKLR